MSDFVSGNIDHGNDTENDLVGQEREPSRRKGTKRKGRCSDVWDFFDVRVDDENKGWGAVCKYCRTELSDDGKSEITQQLKDHLRICWYRPSRKKQRECESKLLEMILWHGFPFSVVENHGFREFVGSLQPNFVMPQSQKDTKSMCGNLFKENKQKVCEWLVGIKGHANVIVDIIESSKNVGHLCLTACVLQKGNAFKTTSTYYSPQETILNFVQVYESHTGDALIKLIDEKLCEWGLDKNLGSVVSAYPSPLSNSFVNKLDSALTGGKSTIFSGGTFHVHSCTHIIDFIVEGCLRALHEVTEKVRQGVECIKASPKYLPMSELFDCLSEGRSIFHILHIVRKFKRVCASLDIPFPFFEQWESVIDIGECLKVCEGIRMLHSIREYSTSNLYFPYLCDLYLLLKQCCSSTNQFTASTTRGMMEKIKGYWDANNLILSLTSILDPQRKMKYIKYYFPLIYGQEVAEIKIQGVREMCYDEYRRRVTSTEEISHIRSCSSSMCSTYQLSESSLLTYSLTEIRRNGDRSNYPKKCDLCKYLEEEVTSQKPPSYGALIWWQGDGQTKFPTLFSMALDVLGIPISTTSVEAAKSFLKTIETYKLEPYNSEAVICLDQWLKESYKERQIPNTTSHVSDIIAEIEKYMDDSSTGPSGGIISTKQQPEGPKSGFMVEGPRLEAATPIPNDVVNDLKGGY